MPASAQTTTLPGIDVSHYQGMPDWSQVQGDGVKFVFNKVTDGTLTLDAQYASNKQEVEALGIAFGA